MRTRPILAGGLRRGGGGGRGGPHGGSRRPAAAGPDQHADQARRRDLRRERVLRPLLRHLPERDQPGRASRGSPPRTARRRSTGSSRPLLTNNPNSVTAAAPRPLRGGHLRPEPRLRRRAEGVRRRPDGQVRPSSRPAARAAAARQVDRHGLLRRQHRHRRCGTRPELRDERQLVRHELRPVDGRRDQPGQRPDARRRRRRRLSGRRERHDHRRPAARRSTTAPTRDRRPAVRQERRRPAERARRDAGAGSRAASSRPRSTRRQGHVQHVAPQRRQRERSATTSRTTSRSSTTPRRPTPTTCRRPRRR